MIGKEKSLMILSLWEAEWQEVFAQGIKDLNLILHLFYAQLPFFLPGPLLAQAA